MNFFFCLRIIFFLLMLWSKHNFIILLIRHKLLVFLNTTYFWRLRTAKMSLAKSVRSDKRRNQSKILYMFREPPWIPRGKWTLLVAEAGERLCSPSSITSGVKATIGEGTRTLLWRKKPIVNSGHDRPTHEISSASDFCT